MGKKPRILGTNLCYHVRSQCNNKAYKFQTDNDFSQYLDILMEAKKTFNLKLHAYGLMHTHTHLIATTPGPAFLDEIMYYINKNYSVQYNKRCHRFGHFWMGPYKCDIIDSDRYALTCMRYIDRNAVHAGLVKDPKHWPWNSHSFYAFNQINSLIDPLPSYVGLANSPTKREEIYRNFVLSVLPSDEKREREMIRKGLQRQKNKKMTENEMKKKK